MSRHRPRSASTRARGRRLGALSILLLTLGCQPGTDREAGTPAPDAETPAGDSEAPSVRFVEVTGEVGLDFVHSTGTDDSDYFMPAVMGSGAVVFDFDGDDDLDLYLVNAGVGPRQGAEDRLFEQRDGRFVDVTAEAGKLGRGYGMGAAAGDIDNDGDLDLFVTNWGADALYRNEGDGTFADVTGAWRISGDGWSTASVFFDADGDGFLDLFVAQYVDYDGARICSQEGGRPDFCGPTQFAAHPDRLYRNVGGRHFEEHSESSGIAGRQHGGLGVVAADLDGNDLIDLYVAQRRRRKPSVAQSGRRQLLRRRDPARRRVQ